jgi:outer membrane protein assembly factor BamB
MGFLAVGEDGLILRLGGKAREHDKPFAPGVKREKYDGSKHLNGVARTTIPGGSFALALAVGDDGVALIRKPTGEWTRALTGTGRDLNAIAIARHTHTAWAVGDEGTILRTTDGGQHWSVQSSHTTRHLRAVVAPEESRAMVAGDDGMIFETSNGGATWREVDPLGLSKHLRGICLGPQLLLAVGDDGALLFRFNFSWFNATLTGKHLRAADIHANDRLLVVGDDGWIGTRHLTPFLGNDPEDHWTVHSGVTTKHLRGIAREESQWAIVGDHEFMTSDDDGASWQKHGAGNLRAVC